MIVETEAYLGPRDGAAHTFGGRRTERVASMWKSPGTAYVYFTYGMHWCMNCVARAEGRGEAVLIRAAEPLDGLEMMRRRRGREGVMELCSGPAKLCQAFGIDRSVDGEDLTSSWKLWVEPRRIRPGRIAITPRIGVDSAKGWAQKPLRFVIAGNRFASRVEYENR